MKIKQVAVKQMKTQTEILDSDLKGFLREIDIMR